MGREREKKIFRSRPIRNKSLLTDRDEMSNLYSVNTHSIRTITVEWGNYSTRARTLLNKV
jgi:hypothetical protein